MKKTVLFLFLIIIISCLAGCEEKDCNHEYPSAEPCQSRVCTLADILMRADMPMRW